MFPICCDIERRKQFRWSILRLCLFCDFSGLKKFLAQYPAIFAIDGDHVSINAFEKSSANDPFGAGTRDYIQESKDYFKHKLLQYGLGTEVPIKSLLGHRSQASPQIRHISGETILPRNLSTTKKCHERMHVNRLFHPHTQGNT